ncbi:MAG: GNAT family N-acetyltransferase [Desulfocapsa sp.]|nr:GNAT family N-acetyltransferase [Desulfocapsa sp.]
MKFIFRNARQDDLPYLVKMLADDKLGALREDNTPPLNNKYLDAFSCIDKDPNNELIVMESGEAIIGMLQLTFIPYLTRLGSWRCLIEGVRIQSQFRGQGLGSELINWAIERAKERHCSLVQLTTDKQRSDALHFYEKLGFKASHEGLKLQL